MELVAVEHFAISDLSIAAQVSHIEAAKPDVILAWVTGTPSGTALRGLHDAGVNVPVLLNAGNINAKQIAGYAGFVPKTLLFPGMLFLAPSVVKSAQVRDSQRQFTDALKAVSAPPVLSAVYAYDAGRVILDAYRHTGITATAAQLRDYIEKIKSFPGVDGMMNFTDGSQRGLSVDGVVIIRWDETKGDFDPVSGAGGIPAP
jgi:branched-chain amino acid transport system substrate-binding protein